VGPFSTAGPLGADYAMWAHIALYYHLDYTPKPVFETGLHQDNFSRNAIASVISQYHLFSELRAEVSKPADQTAYQYRLRTFRWQHRLLRWMGRVTSKEGTTAFQKTSETPVPTWRVGGWAILFLFRQLQLYIQLKLSRE
jgi:hypothetical protein